MTSLARSDIFFIVTTFAVVFVSLGILAVTVYLLYILKEVRALVELIRRESELISEDLGDLRSKVRNEGFKWSSLFVFFRKLWKRKQTRKSRTIDLEN